MFDWNSYKQITIPKRSQNESLKAMKKKDSRQAAIKEAREKLPSLLHSSCFPCLALVDFFLLSDYIFWMWKIRAFRGVVRTSQWEIVLFLFVRGFGLEIFVFLFVGTACNGKKLHFSRKKFLPFENNLGLL